MKEDSKRFYFENLDGLRFICFLMVFLYHSFHTDFDFIKAEPLYKFVDKGLFGNGNLGVNFFFVLSGFLITYLLIKDKKETGKIHIAHFWMRRILRIWPLYFFCVFFGFVVFAWLKQALGQPVNETAHLWNYLTFTSNFDLLYNGSPDASVLSVLWSVAIEEQFYFVWPIFLYLFSVKNYWIPFAGIIALSLIFRMLNDNNAMHELHTFPVLEIWLWVPWVLGSAVNLKSLEAIFKN